MTTSLLQQELKPLNAQIEQVRAKLAALDADLHLTQAKLETIPLHRERYEALQSVCAALDKLTELEASALFWEPLAEGADADRHRQRLQERITGFDDKIRRGQERESALKTLIVERNIELDALFEKVHDAYAREQRRLEELAVEREVSSVPERVVIMPWSSDSASEKAFRHSMLGALLLFVVVSLLMHWVTVPVSEQTSGSVVIPERLAKLVKQEPAKPAPPKVAEKPPEEKKPTEPIEKEAPKEKPKVAATPADTRAARTKAEGSGVLAFKNSFEELIEETPVAGLGSQARLSKGPGTGTGSGGPRASRSLVAIQGKSGSGGISNVTVSRSISNGESGTAGKIGNAGFARVESAVAGLQEEAGRKVSDGPGPARTDEEIQIVFDRYKSTLYRIYNKELRKDPALRGKILLRLTIDPEGMVASCTVEKTDLASSGLVAAIVERVRKFNFGPKKGTPKTTILYPIDFLPAG
ncbi:MAG: AgmX/PglI C-terminal domain-containing protein [Desulfuromonadales bacterium]|nr:AgmX/PglI C-terminal domain-containing protein [Desulfuromonadales bacterium]